MNARTGVSRAPKVTCCALAAAAMLPLSSARALDFDPEMFESLVQQGTEVARQWIDEYEIDWERVGSVMQAALQGDSWADLALVKENADNLYNLLRTIPGTQDHLDWLLQRLDYVDMADWVMRPAPPVRPTPAPPPPRPGARPTLTPLPTRPAPHPTPPPGRAPQPQREKASCSIAQWKSNLARRPPPARAAELVPRLKRIFREEGLPEELVWLAEVESTFNPAAKSPVGAAGLFQFMPATAERFGLQLTPRDERLDPEKSARASAQYLRLLHRRFGDWSLALAAYNAGEGRVGKTLRRHNGKTFEDIAEHLPLETRMYVPKIMAVIELRENLSPVRLPPPS